MQNTTDKPLVLEGMLAVSAALAAGNRVVERVLVSAKLNPRRLDYLRNLARPGSVRIQPRADEQIQRLQAGSSHGGVLALVQPRRWQGFDELLQANSNPLLLMLDGIEDPYSLGWAVRSAYAAGVDGLVLRNRDWGASEATICRASAGAYDRMPIALSQDPFEAAEHCRNAGLKLAMTGQGAGSVSLYDADLTAGLLVFIGGERRGVQRRFRELADLEIEIPYGRNFNAALGAASAATVVAFEALRQRSAAANTEQA
jgi:23S rRNA (guanosine2251-2'-O)-methyltransferase